VTDAKEVGWGTQGITSRHRTPEGKGSPQEAQILNGTAAHFYGFHGRGADPGEL